jgi:uncharacterized protein (TIGR02246 family)
LLFEYRKIQKWKLMTDKKYSAPMMKFCLIFLIFLIPGKYAAAQSGGTDQNQAYDTDHAKAEIAERLRDYENALKNGDAGALADMYTPDAEVLSDGSPSTVGRDEIKKVYEKMVRDSITVSGFTTTGLWGSDELLVEQGTGFFAHAGGKWKSHGRYLLVWKRVDGVWQIFRDTWFRDSK